MLSDSRIVLFEKIQNKSWDGYDINFHTVITRIEKQIHINKQTPGFGKTISVIESWITGQTKRILENNGYEVKKILDRYYISY